MIVPPGFEQPGALGVLDHLHRHAVLDRVAGVERLELGRARSRARRLLVIALIRTIGVWPMASRMVSQIFFTGSVYGHAPSSRRTTMSWPR